MTITLRLEAHYLLQKMSIYVQKYDHVILFLFINQILVKCLELEQMDLFSSISITTYLFTYFYFWSIPQFLSPLPSTSCFHLMPKESSKICVWFYYPDGIPRSHKVKSQRISFVTMVSFPKHPLNIVAKYVGQDGKIKMRWCVRSIQ